MTKNPKALKLFSPLRITITIILGLSVATYLVARNFNLEYFKAIEWTWYSSFWIFIALCMMAIRDIAYMYRIRVLTDYQISWRHSFDTIMLWEFASAISPSIVGGSSVAIYIVNKEGVKVGRSTAVVLVSAFLDELFYIVTVPIIILIVGYKNLFPVQLQREIFGIVLGTKGIFLVGYFFYFIANCLYRVRHFFFGQEASNGFYCRSSDFHS